MCVCELAHAHAPGESQLDYCYYTSWREYVYAIRTAVNHDEQNDLYVCVMHVWRDKMRLLCGVLKTLHVRPCTA